MGTYLPLLVHWQRFEYRNSLRLRRLGKRSERRTIRFGLSKRWNRIQSKDEPKQAAPACGGGAGANQTQVTSAVSRAWFNGPREPNARS